MDESKVAVGIWLFALGWIAFAAILVYRLVRRVWRKTISRKYHYSDLQLSLIMATVYALTVSIFIIAGAIPSALETIGYVGKYTPYILAVVSFLIWVVPGVVCTFVANALVAGNARGKAPYITYWVLLVCLNMADSTQWLCIVTTMILSGVILMQMMANPSTDEYKQAQEAVWPESDPMWREKQREKRREWLIRTKFVPLALVGIVLLVCGISAVYSLGYKSGQDVAKSNAASEIQQVSVDAYNSGYADGENAGYENGYAYGQKYGLEEGYERGKAAFSNSSTSSSSASNSIYNNGYVSGFEYGAECMLKELVETAQNVVVYARYNGGEIIWEYHYDK